MANILYNYIQPIIDKDNKKMVCYYEGMVNELIAHGNNVCIHNTINKKNLSEKNIKKITEFKPDVIFAFNNATMPQITHITNCPIIVFAEDTYHFFQNKDLIEKYADRYYLVTADENVNEYEKYFLKNHCFLISHATAVKNENIEKKRNISFIGQPFLYNLVNTIDRKAAYNALTDLYDNGNYNYDELLQKYKNNINLNLSQKWGVFDIRISTLITLQELGLEIFGIGWDNLNLSQLFLSYNNKPIYSLNNNQNIYNSSIININIQHPQNNGYGCAWRVYDIMASSGLLISHQSSLLKNKTKEYTNIPMYNSPLEAADLCRKYLKEKNLREDIIMASNEFIEKNGRWINNFKIIENIINMKITNTHKTGEKIFIENEYFKPKKTKCWKNIKNGYRLILSNLPLTNKLYNEAKINKLYDSIYRNREQ